MESMNTNIEVLVVTMNQKDDSLLAKMNIQRNAIISNQSKQEYLLENNSEFKKKNIKFINTNTCGVGINRNIALFHSKADICLLADDDMRFIDNYEELVNKAFLEVSDADIIIFNIDGDERIGKVNHKISRVNYWNCMSYGAPRIAFRKKSIEYAALSFSTIFGGGTKHSAGEDSMFLINALKKGLKIYTYPISIAKIYPSESSWFTGYHDKYFYDKGAWIAATFNLLKYPILFHFVINRRKDKGIIEAFKLMHEGMRGYRMKKSFEEYKNNRNDINGE